MSPSSSISAPGASEKPGLHRLAGTRLGNYRLERLVGRGRMGVVYLAKDEALLRPTAIKVLAWSVAEAQGHDPVQWFLAEARLVARINDPRVVQIYGAARQGDLCYIAMEYVAGTSAEAMVAAGERMTPEAATDVLLQAASALHAAHRSGVVHRDIKPANLLIGAGGVTKLGDFGMALGGTGGEAGDPRARVGTPFYTAPEIWRGGGASTASDIYALGATYFHLLTGRPPYLGRGIPEVEEGHLRSPVPDPRQLVPSLPASAAELVGRALAKNPSARQPSAQVLMWEARRVLQDLVAANHASSPSLPRPSRAPPERRPPPEPVPLPPATGPLAEVLRFAHRPFADVDPAAWPYEGEPHASVRRRILASIDDEATVLCAVTGAPGSGRSAMCRRIASELSPTRLVLYLDLRAEREGRTVIQRLCRAASVPEDGPEEIEGLHRRLAEERQAGRPSPLVVLDGVRPGDPSAAGLAAVVGAAVWSRSFRVLASGEADLLEGLAMSGVSPEAERVLHLPIPPLERQQVAFYVRNWLQATLAPGAPPVLLTPDALLLLARRSGGVLARVNTIAENMLLLAAAERRRTISSWHAWTASDRERWAGTRLETLPRRPGSWPPVEVVAVLDACRRAAGMPPWPRGEGR